MARMVHCIARTRDGLDSQIWLNPHTVEKRRDFVTEVRRDWRNMGRLLSNADISPDDMYVKTRTYRFVGPLKGPEGHPSPPEFLYQEVKG